MAKLGETAEAEDKLFIPLKGGGFTATTERASGGSEA